MMRYVLAIFLLFGVQVAGSAPIADVNIDILNSSADGLQARITFPADSGQRVPLGFMIVPEGASLNATASLAGLEPNGSPVVVEIGNPAFIREVRVVTVALISPDAVERGTVLTIDVELNLSSVPTGPIFRGYLPPSFVDILRSSALNWDQVEVEERSPAPRYLLIAPDVLSGTVGPLFDWKERKGLGPELVTLNDIGSSDPYDIRLYIQDKYNTTGTLEYVLLIGDHPLMPTFTGYYNPVPPGFQIPASDHYYAAISGGDDLPDIHVGRLPASSAVDLAALIDKVLAYERGDEADIWMHRAVMASGNQHSSHKGTKRTIRNQLLGFGYDLVDTVFAPDQGVADLIGAVTEGRSIVNYRGGLATRQEWTAIGFDNDDCNYLGNGKKRPLVFSLICLTGDFTDSEICLGEAWMKAAGGAIGFFAASQETHTFVNNTLDLGLFDAIINQGLRPMGAITDAGLYYMYYNYAPGDTVLGQLLQYNLLGDPETPLWVGEPGTMSVDHPTSVPQATSDVVVSTGVGGAYVCLRGAGVYEAVYADGSGNAYLQITPTSSDQIDVTVTGYNMIPYEGQMAVTQTYTIAGNVYTEDGPALEGVTMTLTGDAYDQATTNADGWYSFPNLNQGGYYTVTPSFGDASGTWTFGPESMTYDNLQGDQWGQEYAANAPRYVLAGTVKASWGTPLEGVAVDLAGYQSAQVLTNQSGWYQFDNVRGGQNYSVTPSYYPQEGGWSFDPGSRSYEFLDSNHWADDYSGTPPYYTIAGIVTEEERGALEGVQIVLSGDAAETTSTGSDGSYTLGPLAGGDYYTVTPFYSPLGGQWPFEPQDYQFQPLLGTQTGADFEGSRPRYTLSGSILTRDGSGLEGVLVRLGGGKADSVLTDLQGSYALSDVPGGLSYTLMPALAFNDSIQWYFSPETVEIDTLRGNQDQIEFLGQLPVLCYLGDGEGQPGSTGNPILLNFDNETYNSAAVDSLVFTILYSSAFGANVPEENAVEVIGRAEEFEVSYQVNESNPAACSLYVTLTGTEPLPAGTDSICRVLFSLDAGADTSRATELSFVSASAWDSAGVEIPVDSHDTGVFGSGVGASPSVGPERFRLFPPSPNPSTGEVSFSFQIPRSAKATIVIRDLTGRVVNKLSPGVLRAGQHTIKWDGRSQRDKILPSGTYHCQLVACGETAHSLVVLVR